MAKNILLIITVRALMNSSFRYTANVNILSASPHYQVLSLILFLVYTFVVPFIM